MHDEFIMGGKSIFCINKPLEIAQSKSSSQGNVLCALGAIVFILNMHFEFAAKSIDAIFFFKIIEIFFKMCQRSFFQQKSALLLSLE